jgi:hypothetical protein
MPHCNTHFINFAYKYVCLVLTCLLLFLLCRPYPEGCAIPEAVMQKMRAEFEFWYPFDLRVSGEAAQPGSSQTVGRQAGTSACVRAVSARLCIACMLELSSCWALGAAALLTCLLASCQATPAYHVTKPSRQLHILAACKERLAVCIAASGSRTCKVECGF